MWSRATSENEANMPSDDRYWDEPDEERPRRRPAARSKQTRIWIWLIAGFGALGACVLLCCGGGYFGVRAFLSPTTFPEQTEDYAEARAKFRTRLITQGPAPQD